MSGLHEAHRSWEHCLFYTCSGDTGPNIGSRLENKISISVFSFLISGSSHIVEWEPEKGCGQRSCIRGFQKRIASEGPTGLRHRGWADPLSSCPTNKIFMYFPTLVLDCSVRHIFRDVASRPLCSLSCYVKGEESRRQETNTGANRPDIFTTWRVRPEQDGGRTWMSAASGQDRLVAKFKKQTWSSKVSILSLPDHFSSPVLII